MLNVFYAWEERKFKKMIDFKWILIIGDCNSYERKVINENIDAQDFFNMLACLIRNVLILPKN